MERRRFFGIILGAGVAAIAAPHLEALAPVAKASPTQADAWLTRVGRGEQQTRELTRLLATSESRKSLAAHLGPSLQRRLTVMSLTRNHLTIRPVSTYKGALEVNQCYPMIPLSDIREKRHDLVARSLNLGKAELGATEDAMFFRKIDDVTAPVAIDRLNRTGLEEMIDVNGTPATAVFCNPFDYVDTLKDYRLQIDREYRRNYLKRGVMGYYKGATLVQTRRVPPGLVYSVAHPPEPERSIFFERAAGNPYSEWVSAQIVYTALVVHSEDHFFPDEDENKYVAFPMQYHFAVDVNPHYVKRANLKHAVGRSDPAAELG